MKRALAVLAGTVVSAVAAPTSFSCAVSTVTLHAGQPALTVCDHAVTPGSGGGYASQHWMTGTDVDSPNGIDDVLIEIFIDGEAVPSVSLYPYQMTMYPSWHSFNISRTSMPAQTWTSALFQRNSATSWVNTLPIPFTTSYRVQLSYTPAAGSTTIYFQTHGVDGVAPQIGLVPLPVTARLHIDTGSLVMQPLDYLALVNRSAGEAGLIAGIAIAFTAPNENTLEGCTHLYTTAATPYPGMLHATGTEDEFLSSYYYDLGPFYGKSAGLFYKLLGANATLAMYRTYQDAPMIFTDGGSFVWRNGDTSDPATGIKCMMQTGGNKAGNPGVAAVDWMAWYYTY